MTEDVQSLVLEHLRAIRKDVADIKGDLMDLKVRVSSIEGVLGYIQTQIAAQSVRMDRFDERLTRIERRLDLVEA